MGWRFRKSIGGKYFRVNLGRHGVTSTTFGKRGAPHVTVSRNGTRVGTSVPGTELYYTQKIHGPSTETTRFPAVRPSGQPTTPPVVPPGGEQEQPNGHRPPWSRLVIASIACGAVGLPFAPFQATAQFAQFMATVALILSIIGLAIIIRKKNGHSVTAAIVAILLSLTTGMTATASLTDSTSTTEARSHSSSTSTSKTSASKAKEKRASAEKKAQKEKEKAQKEASEELDAAKTALVGKITEAHTLLDSSNNNVADPQTRLALTDAINAAAAVNSTDPQEYTGAVGPLQTAMDTVNASVQQKKQNDAAAAQAAAQAAAAEAQAQAQSAAAAQAQADAQVQQQQQQQQQSTGTAHGGAFCSPEGAQAQSDRSSNILTCRVAADGRLRWKL